MDKKEFILWLSLLSQRFYRPVFIHLDTLYSTFSRVNGTSAPSVSAIEVQDVKKGKLKVKNTIYGSLGFADLFVRLKIYSKFAAKTFLEWTYLF